MTNPHTGHPRLPLLSHLPLIHLSRAACAPDRSLSVIAFLRAVASFLALLALMTVSGAAAGRLFALPRVLFAGQSVLSFWFRLFWDQHIGVSDTRPKAVATAHYRVGGGRPDAHGSRPQGGEAPRGFGKCAAGCGGPNVLYYTPS